MTVLSLFLGPVMCFSCSSGQIDRVYRHTITREIPVQSAMISKDAIDGTKTYEIQFRLKEPADCVKIGINSSYKIDSLPSKTMSARTFFIVERVLDISQFKETKSEIYILMGKNYTTQWEHRPAITICPPEDDPLQRLDSKSLYRIRFSALLGIDFIFTVTINSDTPVEIIQ